MSMELITEEQIKKIYDYFKPIDKVRYSDWVTEMRRQIGLQLLSQDISVLNVSKVIRTNRFSPYHYKSMIPRNECMLIVKEKLWEWIDKELYPRSVYFGNRKNRTHWIEYELNDANNLYPAYKKKRSGTNGKKRLGSSLDNFIDNI